MTNKSKIIEDLAHELRCKFYEWFDHNDHHNEKMVNIIKTYLKGINYDQNEQPKYDIKVERINDYHYSMIFTPLTYQAFLQLCDIDEGYKKNHIWDHKNNKVLEIVNLDIVVEND